MSVRVAPRKHQGNTKETMSLAVSPHRITPQGMGTIDINAFHVAIRVAIGTAIEAVSKAAI